MSSNSPTGNPTGNPAKRTRTLLLAGAMGGAALLGGGAAMTMFQPASAQTSTTTAPAAASGSTSAPAGPDAGPGAGHAAPDPAKGGHQANGITEQLLTGDTAAKVTAAAQAAVPGGTIQRVENDAEGATYEAHVVKSDGSQVTVKLDASFDVTSTENGPR